MQSPSAAERQPLSLYWLPPAPDFRAQLRSAVETTDVSSRLEKLAVIAQSRLGFLETIQLDRTLGQSAAYASEFKSLRLAVLGSATINHLVPPIRVAGLRRGFVIDAYAGAYGQYRTEILDAASALRRFAPQAVLFSLTARELTATLSLTATAAETDAAIDRWIEGLRQLWQHTREAFDAAPIQQTLLDVSEPLFGSYDRLVAAAPTHVVARANDQLAQAAKGEGVLLLDVTRPSQRNGIDAWFDVARWYQAKMEIAPQAAPLYGDLVLRLLAADRGLSKKCLVFDLDNTLWGGVVGDDGLEGIILGEGSAAGEAYRALQQYAKHLKERGVILAVCSKNDPQIAEAAFRDHPEMVLSRSDIAAFVANWQDKAENLKAIAAELNIGIDSLVFVDDNPVERARVRASLPLISVPELPEDPAHYARCVADAGYFEAVAFTSEDRERSAAYAANVERQALRDSLQSLDDFLQGLRMSVAFGPFAALDLPRVTQLINKTNQFNPTTRRYSDRDLSLVAAAADNLTLQLRLLDRFGDNGLVSAMILKPHFTEPDALVIDTWVMSCRVFGRQLELEAMNIAVEAARQRGVRAFHADYIPTAKNAVVRDLYANLGFTQTPEMSNDGASRWTLTLDDYIAQPTHIDRLPSSK